jgi:hypothetical protein
MLGECGLFRGLGPEERAALIARVRIHNFAAGESVFLRGAPGDNMMADQRRFGRRAGARAGDSASRRGFR